MSAVAAKLPAWVRDEQWLYPVLFGVLTAAVLLELQIRGLLSYPDTISDERDHFARVMAAAQLWSGQLFMSNLAAVYDQGIWPPLYPLLLGACNALFGFGLAADRVLNVLFVAVGLYCLGLPVRGRVRLLALPFAVLFLIFNPEYFQIRPENLALLLIGAAICIAIRSGAFSPGGTANWRIHVLLGVIFGLLPLTHATYTMVALYGVLLACLALRQRWPFVAALLLVTLPYVAAQNLMTSRLTLFATSSEEGLVRNNNPYWNRALPYSVNFEQTFVKLLTEVRARIADGDLVMFPRPALIPKSHYAQWLAYENKRRIFRDIALQTIRDDPAGYLLRIPERLASVAFPTLCEPAGASPYACRLAPAAVVEASWLLTLTCGVAALGGLWLCERRHLLRGFTFLGFCAALLLPMTLITALGRQFMLIPPLLVFGMLWHLGKIRAGAPEAEVPV